MRVTAGFKCAPEIGPRIVISTIRIEPGRDGVAEESNGLITPGQAFGHDARTDDGRDQESGTKSFGDKPPGKRDGKIAHDAVGTELSLEAFALPMASSCFWSESAQGPDGQCGRRC